MFKILSGNQLKILALVCMTVDHIGFILLPSYTLLRIVGRLAFPIFAYMVAEGFVHTRDRLRYFMTMAIAASVCQIVYFFVLESLDQCIFVTFSLSILLCAAADRLRKEVSVFHAALCAVSFAAVWFLCEVVPQILDGFSVQYGFWGVVLPTLVLVAPSKPTKLLLFAVGLCALALSAPYWEVQWFALLSVVPLALYDGTRGKHRMKYLFYVYYPLHLIVIYGISYFV